jgi:hypothetical protein
MHGLITGSESRQQLYTMCTLHLAAEHVVGTSAAQTLEFVG